MLRFVTGATGGGKTTYATDDLITQLRESNRGIAVFMALQLHPWVNKKGKPMRGLLWHLESRYGETFDAERRIYFLKREELKRFYACRVVVPEDPSEPRTVVWVPPRPKDPEKPQSGLWYFDGRQFPPMAFYIDEAHEEFPQEAWKDIGTEVQSWASQNRRTGDHALLITQQSELVAKPFRRQSLECIWMVNLAYKTVGPFRQPEKIRYYVHVHTPPKDSEKPLRKGTVTHPGGWIQECFDTSGGGSVSHGHADLGEKAKGLNWKWAPAGALALIVCAYLALEGCAKAVSHALTGTTGKPGVKNVTQGQHFTNRGPQRPFYGPTMTPPPSMPKAPPLTALPKNTNKPPTISGYFRIPGSPTYTVVLSTGETFEAKEIVKEGIAAIVADGHIYPFQNDRHPEKWRE